ncbi:predicted protein [Postia placenta Mad-698-R]|nr:predicted protein [Postia placenta Mad-698-R]
MCMQRPATFALHPTRPSIKSARRKDPKHTPHLDCEAHGRDCHAGVKSVCPASAFAVDAVLTRIRRHPVCVRLGALPGGVQAHRGVGETAGIRWRGRAERGVCTGEERGEGPAVRATAGCERGARARLTAAQVAVDSPPTTATCWNRAALHRTGCYGRAGAAMLEMRSDAGATVRGERLRVVVAGEGNRERARALAQKARGRGVREGEVVAGEDRGENEETTHPDGTWQTRGQ